MDMGLVAERPLVFVVDDDPSVRSSLGRVLASAGYAVETFGTAASFLQRPPVTGPACLLLDVHLEGMSGPELHAELCRREDPLPVVYLTADRNVHVGVAAIKGGAVDYLTKPSEAGLLLGTVEHALSRQRSQRASLDTRQRVHDHARLLSPREREVLHYVIGGWLNKQIAAELGIAEKTVKVHRSRMLEKMGTRSLAELVRVCAAAGIPPKERPAR